MTHTPPPFCWCHDDTFVVGGILPPHQFSPLDIAHFYDPTKEMVVIPDGAKILPDEDLNTQCPDCFYWRNASESTCPNCALLDLMLGQQHTEPDATLEEPQEGETYITSWSELLYEMTDGALGTKPPTRPRRYEP